MAAPPRNTGDAWHRSGDSHFVNSAARFGSFLPARRATDALIDDKSVYVGPLAEDFQDVRAPRAMKVGERTRLDLQATALRDGDAWRVASGFSQMSFTLTTEQAAGMKANLQKAKTTDRASIPGTITRMEMHLLGWPSIIFLLSHSLAKFVVLLEILGHCPCS